MKKIILLSFLLWCGGLFAQPHVQVVRDATNADFIQQSVAEFSPGVYVVAGTVTPGPVSGDSDILVVMTNNAGTILWAKYVDYGQDEFAGSVMVDAAFNIVLTGYAGVNGSSNKDLIVAKLDGSGNLLADIRIGDSGTFGYGLYGFDLEQANSGEYIVVGTGVAFPSLAAGKYAFVLKVNQALSGIVWSRIYRSNLSSCPSCPTNFDSFNHILKVSTSPLTASGEAYLLTGSGADITTNKQMVVNDLIDPNTGNGLWGSPVGYNNGGVGYPFKGTMALQRGTGTGIEFYVLHPAARTIPLISIVDGLSGNVNATIGAGGWPNNIINGMAWEDPAVQNNIVFSGYRTSYPAGAPWAPTLTSIDITGPTFLWSHSYLPPFSYNDYQNITFDYIVQPIHHITVGIGNLDNQFFYQPKALIRSTTGFQFAVPHQNSPGNPFSLGLFNTNLNGDVDMDCMQYPEGSSEQGNPFPPFVNFSSTSYFFNIIGSSPSVINTNPTSMITCD